MKRKRILLPGFLIACITLCVTCDEGTYNVPEASSQARFTYNVDNNSIAPAQVAFTNKSLNALSYSWDFGNGETSSEENPTMTFNQAGNFTVKLTITAPNPDLHYNNLVSEQTVTIKDNPISRLFFGDRTIGVVKFVDLDDSPFPILKQFSHSGLGKPYGMAVDTARSKLYVTDYRYQYMYRYNLDGSDVEVLMTEPTPNFDSPFGIIVIEDKIVWADSAGFHRANLDASNPEVWIKLGPSVPEMPLDLDYDPATQEIYFSNDKYEFSGGIFKIKTDGTGLTKLVDGTNGGALAIDPENNRMYYYDYDKGMCLNTLDGQNEVVFDPSVVGMMTWGCAIDKYEGKIYYSNRVDMTVMRANLDGSGVETFIPAEAEINPNAMAIDKPR